MPCAGNNLTRDAEMLCVFVCGQEEHEAIVSNRKDRDAGLTWAEYKSMTFTSQVSLTGSSYYTLDTARIAADCNLHS